MFRRLAAASILWALLAGAAVAKPVELTILHTNDTHDRLESFDSPKAKDVGGVARRATLFKQIRAERKNVLVLDAGDVFQGTPLFTFFEGEPDYMTMEQSGYDAIAVGNHDLDNGLANLQRQSKHLSHPPLSVNLVGKDGQLLFPGYRTFERDGLKIAVIGVLGINAYEAIAEDKRKDVFVLDPIPVLKQVVGKLRGENDLVVVVSHSGHEEELEMAAKVPGIDVIVGGHSHTKIEKPVAVVNGDRTTLVVQAFQWGEYVGQINLTVDDGRVQSYRGELLPVTSAIPPDPIVQATVDRYAKQIADKMNQVVGQSSVEFLNSRKAMGDAPIGNLIADALRAETGTDIGIMNSGGIRASLPKGPITRGMVFSMLPFENRLVTFHADGQMVKDLVGFAADRLGKSGSLQISGLSFTVKGGKVTEIKVGGQPLDPKRVYTVTTIDYLANGNDGAGVFKKARELRATGQLIRDAFFNYMKENPTLQTPQGGRIVVK